MPPKGADEGAGFGLGSFSAESFAVAAGKLRVAKGRPYDIQEELPVLS